MPGLLTPSVVSAFPPYYLLCLLRLSTENSEEQCTNCKAVVRSTLVSFQRRSDGKNTKWGSFRKESLQCPCEEALSSDSPAIKLSQDSTILAA